MIRTCLRMLVLGFGLLVSAGSLAAQPVVIGSTNFPEQLILANIYNDVLKAHGVDTKMRLNLGSRELVFPALKAGELDILPEYTGALLGYLTRGESQARQESAVLAELKEKLPQGIVMLKPASAQDKDALVVTAETASQYHLQTMSDLAGVASKMTLGGPPELKTRFIGLPGFKQVYGLEFKTFRSLDAGGPLTVGALANGDIDVALMFTTQGVIGARGWVVLRDDKGMISAQNLVPVVREAVLTPTIRDALNAVSAQLTTEGLQKMNHQVEVEKRGPDEIAREWVEEHGLATP